MRNKIDTARSRERAATTDVVRKVQTYFPTY